MMTFAGLQADARVLIDKVRMECQSFRFNYEDAPSVEYIARFMAETQQKYTQRGGVRPFGISAFLTGFYDGKPYLYQTEPSGAVGQWKASAVGKKSKELREYLENKYAEGLNQQATMRLAIETLLEVVESEKNIELCIVKAGNLSENVSEARIQAVVAEINAEKEAKEEEKRNR
jgi:20S proteasome subunit alpha 4